jgi:hypothetical protein
MEKVMFTVRTSGDGGLADRLRGPVSDELLTLDLPGVTINVRDAPVRSSLMTLTTLDPPIQAFVSIWTEQHYGTAVQAALEVLRGAADEVAAYLVTESVPMPPPRVAAGERTPGLANIAVLRRPADVDESTWLHRWQHDHTPIAIETQATFGYVQNYVVRSLTDSASPISAIVEELFPIEAVDSLHAFFGAADDEDLRQRLAKMVASTSAFGANGNIDTVPTSRYVLKDPFA